MYRAAQVSEGGLGLASVTWTVPSLLPSSNGDSISTDVLRSTADKNSAFAIESCRSYKKVEAIVYAEANNDVFLIVTTI